MSERAEPPANTVPEATVDAAVSVLHEATRRHGLNLPGLTTSYTTVNGAFLVHLGHTSSAVALKLAQILNRTPVELGESSVKPP